MYMGVSIAPRYKIMTGIVLLSIVLVIFGFCVSLSILFKDYAPVLPTAGWIVSAIITLIYLWKNQ